MTEEKIVPAKNLLGSLQLPGDKSISHRYGMLAALAEGKSTFANFSTGADCQSTLACASALGAKVTRNNGLVEIEGVGGNFRKPASPLDCGNSGSTMRMMAGILAGQDFDCELFGDSSLMRRPMARVQKPLRQFGAQIELKPDGRPPMQIRGGKLKAIDFASDVPSAQVKSAVLFAGLQASGITSYDESIRTRDHSELALRAFGAEITRTRNRISIEGNQRLLAIDATVPGDISSAAFFFCASALFPKSNLVVQGVGLNPTRAALLDVLSSLGAKVSMLNVEEKNGELTGTVKVEHGRLRSLKIDASMAALLIDELPVLAAIGPYTEEGIEIRGARELRVKESDRIAAVAAGLRAMGAEVQEYEDGLFVKGNQKLHGATIDSFGDHRIAMAFSIAALRAEGETIIKDSECAGISFPEFFTLLRQISEV